MRDSGASVAPYTPSSCPSQAADEHARQVEGSTDQGTTSKTACEHSANLPLLLVYRQCNTRTSIPGVILTNKYVFDHNGW